MLRNYIEQRMREDISRGTIFLTTCVLILGLTQPALAKNERLIAEKQQSALETWAQGMIFTLTQPESGEQQGVTPLRCEIHAPSDIDNSSKFPLDSPFPQIPSDWLQANCYAEQINDTPTLTVEVVNKSMFTGPGIAEVFFPNHDDVSGANGTGGVMIMDTYQSSVFPVNAFYWGGDQIPIEGLTDSDHSFSLAEHVTYSHPYTVVMKGRVVQVQPINTNTQLALPYRMLDNQVEIEIYPGKWILLRNIENNIKARMEHNDEYDITSHTLVATITDDQVQLFSPYRPLPQAEVHSGAKAEVVASPLSTDEPIDPITGLPSENTPVPESSSLPTVTSIFLDLDAKSTFIQNPYETIPGLDNSIVFELLDAVKRGDSPTKVAEIISRLTSDDNLASNAITNWLTEHFERTTGHNPDHPDMVKSRAKLLDGQYELISLARDPNANANVFRFVGINPNGLLEITYVSKADIDEIVRRGDTSKINLNSSSEMTPEVERMLIHIIDSIFSDGYFPTILATTSNRVAEFTATKNPSAYAKTIGIPEMVEVLVQGIDGSTMIPTNIPTGIQLEVNGIVQIGGQTYFSSQYKGEDYSHFSPYLYELKNNCGIVTGDGAIIYIPITNIVSTNPTKEAVEAARNIIDNP